ncbi:hypothetical protein BKA82DRAFT_3938749, partial [Pisolithus tinctorius]
LAFARKTEWLAVRALAQCTSRFPLAFQAESKPLNLDLQVVKSLTVLGTKERFRSVSVNGLGLTVISQKAFELYLQAFKELKTTLEQNKLANFLKNLVLEWLQGLFGHDTFTSAEAHGGLYRLHSHLSLVFSQCFRTASQSVQCSITTITKNNFNLRLISYTDPDCKFRERCRRLAEWSLGLCRCEQ